MAPNFQSSGEMASLHTVIQTALIATIAHPSFDASLPPLSDTMWSKLLAPAKYSSAENDRLEFLGDALMYATIGRLLYAEVPNGSPHLYTETRAALHSNATFSHLAEKLDILAVSSSVLKALTVRNFGEGAAAPMLRSKPEIKATADLFETVIGAYYLEQGFEALCDWVRVIYKPLIAVARKSFYDWTSLRKCKRPREPDITGRSSSDGDDAKRPRLERVLPRRVQIDRFLAEDDPPRASSSKSTEVCKPIPSTIATRPPSTRAKVSLITQPPRKPRILLNMQNPIRLRTPTRIKAPLKGTMLPSANPRPIVIDLTWEADSSDDEELPDAIRLRGTPASHKRRSMQRPRSNSGTALPRDAKARCVRRKAVLGSDDDTEDESVLEEMLTMTIDGSDMALDSDAE